MQPHVQKVIEEFLHRIEVKKAEIVKIEEMISMLTELEKPGEIKLSSPGGLLRSEAIGLPPKKEAKTRGTRKGKRFVGVTTSKSGKFRAQVWHKGKVVSISNTYCTDVEAAKAVDAFLVQNGREPRNFPAAR